MDHPEIVGNEHQRQTEIPLKIFKQIQDLGLDGNIQRGDRLVRDDQLRLRCQRPRDGDTLPLPPENSCG